MDGNAEITMTWGDGEHTFRIGKKQTAELEGKVDMGLEALCILIRDGNWRLHYLRETIRIGLIGGGMAPVAAATLMQNYFDDTPMMQHKPFAYAILLAALYGPPHDPIDLGKAQRGNGAGDGPSQQRSESPVH